MCVMRAHRERTAVLRVDVSDASLFWDASLLWGAIRSFCQCNCIRFFCLLPVKGIPLLVRAAPGGQQYVEVARRPLAKGQAVRVWARPLSVVRSLVRVYGSTSRACLGRGVGHV